MCIMRTAGVCVFSPSLPVNGNMILIAWSTHKHSDPVHIREFENYKLNERTQYIKSFSKRSQLDYT